MFHWTIVAQKTQLKRPNNEYKRSTYKLWHIQDNGNYNIIEHEVPMSRTRVQSLGLQMTLNSHFKHDRSKIIFLNHM